MPPSPCGASHGRVPREHRRCAPSCPPRPSTAGARPTPSSRSCPTTCRSSSTPSAWGCSGSGATCCCSCTPSSRASRSCTWRSTAATGAGSSTTSATRSSACSGTSATRSRTGRRWWSAHASCATDSTRRAARSRARRSPRRVHCSTGSPTGTSSSSATASTRSCTRARTSRSSPSTAPGWGSCDARGSSDRARSRGCRAIPLDRAPPPHADAHEVQRAVHRAPARAHGLHRGQALRRKGPRDRRAPPARPADRARVQGRRHGRPDRAAQGAPGARAGRAAPWRPRREGAVGDPRLVPARRALPDRRGDALRPRDRDPRPRRAPVRARVRAPRRVRALRLLPRLPAPRALPHRQPPEDPGDPARRGRRDRDGLRPAAHRVGARAAAHRHHDGAGATSPRSTSGRSRSGSRRRPAAGPTTSASRCAGGRVAAAPTTGGATRRRSRSSYRADNPVAQAVRDIRSIDDLYRTGGLDVRLYRSVDGLRCRVLTWKAALELSDIVPILEHMGVRVRDERPYEITPVDAPVTHISDFGLVSRSWTPRSATTYARPSRTCSGAR